MSVLLLRHAQTEFNAVGRMQGRNDSPLTRKGKERLERLTRELLVPRTLPEQAYASPLGRAQASAAVIEELCGLSFTTADELSEIDFGQATGLTHQEFEQRFEDHARARAAHRFEAPWPGGESYRLAFDRAAQWVSRTGLRTDGPDVWLLAHQSINRMLLAALLGWHGKSALHVTQNNDEIIVVTGSTARKLSTHRPAQTLRPT